MKIHDTIYCLFLDLVSGAVLAAYGYSKQPHYQLFRIINSYNISLHKALSNNTTNQNGGYWTWAIVLMDRGHIITIYIYVLLVYNAYNAFSPYLSYISTYWPEDRYDWDKIARGNDLSEAANTQWSPCPSYFIVILCCSWTG